MAFTIQLEYETCTAYRTNGNNIRKESKLGIDLEACTRSGDCEPACRYITEKYKPNFLILRETDRKGIYVQEKATHKDKALACKRIYHDSSTDFPSSEEICDQYLVWAAAHSLD